MPANRANKYDPTQIGTANSVLTNAIRDVATVQQGFGTNQSYVSQGYDYAVIENARKLEEGVDYKVDTKLGFISLSTALSADEVLAVALVEPIRPLPPQAVTHKTSSDTVRS